MGETKGPDWAGAVLVGDDVPCVGCSGARSAGDGVADTGHYDHNDDDPNKQPASPLSLACLLDEGLGVWIVNRPLLLGGLGPSSLEPLIDACLSSVSEQPGLIATVDVDTERHGDPVVPTKSHNRLKFRVVAK